ncbi:histone deacetylase [Coemansia guatemalensis]|uniref:histone deacetylase n=1 Tax=Coemansia guatemalensis TaxID=2761395 RepID=A0A9W8HVD9_9FUNG|nr:histone deacetylase [Coemansia guatemalensis]
MKPHRIRMTHNLVMSYELYKRMSIYRAAPATCQEMTQFHSDDYVDFLHRVTPENAAQFQRELGKYNFEEDCPVFDGMFDLFSLSAGSSMEGAARLNRGLSDICINWSGGLHHAKKCEASGFCYINDIVLAILELLRHHQRVLYIDIDVHHGDGVEEAFYTTDRVMTCSFHKYGEFFPGTGDLRDIGEAKGKYYAVNFPLRDGIDDISYQSVFKPVIEGIMEWYQPNAIVLQCGTDSLAGDKLGCFNLSMDGHAECVRFVKDFNLPTLVLGGGGYTIRNVSRVWAYETGILVGVDMDRKLPMNDYMDYYAPEYTLDVPAYNVDNSNSFEYLDRIMKQVLQNLKRTHFAPSVQMQDVPRDIDRDTADEDALDPDERMPEPMRDQHIVPDAEIYEADSLGLQNVVRDGTKVINEETNVADRISADHSDVEMKDAEPPASELHEQTSKVSEDTAMDVDESNNVPSAPDTHTTKPASTEADSSADTSVPQLSPGIAAAAIDVQKPVASASTDRVTAEMDARPESQLLTEKTDVETTTMTTATERHSGNGTESEKSKALEPAIASETMDSHTTEAAARADSPGPVLTGAGPSIPKEEAVLGSPAASSSSNSNVARSPQALISAEKQSEKSNNSDNAIAQHTSVNAVKVEPTYDTNIHLAAAEEPAQKDKDKVEKALPANSSNAPASVPAVDTRVEAIIAAEKEEGEATDDNNDDEDGEIRYA